MFYLNLNENHITKQDYLNSKQEGNLKKSGRRLECNIISEQNKMGKGCSKNA